jgi:hypothetical protein
MVADVPDSLERRQRTYELRISTAHLKKAAGAISVTILLPHGSNISDFDLAAFHRWLVSAGYRSKYIR